MKTIPSSPKTLILTAFVLWLGHFFVDLMIGIWPVYKTMAHIDLAKAGLISTGCAFAGEGMQLLFGSLSDKGYGKALVVFGILATIASTLLAYTDNLFMLSLLFFFTCLGSGAFHPAAVSWMGELTTNRKGLFITIFASGGMLGMALSQLIFFNVFYQFEGHTTILAIPLIALILFLGASRLSACSNQTNPKTHFSLSAFRDFFLRKDLKSLYISQVCTQSILWGLIFLLPDILSMREYDQWICFGGGHLCLVLGTFFMLVPAGYLADRYSCRTVLIFAASASIVLLYVFLFMPMLPNLMLLTLLFFLGAALGVINPVSIALGTRLVPDKPGLVSAFLMGMVWCISEGIGQGGGGFLATLFSEDGPARALSVIGALFVIGLAAMYNLPKEVPLEIAAQEITQ
jgi:MFS transporter, FSR family, fosmidomycin resistance protein